MLATVAKLSFSPYLPNSPGSPTFMGPLIALCFALLAIVAKLSFSPYLLNSPVSPTFMGPTHCFVLCLVGDSGNIVIFTIFAKFAIVFSFLPFLLLRAFLDISLKSRTSRQSHGLKLGMVGTYNTYFRNIKEKVR